MLSVVGRSTAERSKSIAIALLTGLLILALWQVANVTTQATRETHDRQVAADVARRFALALTTYDYAHPDVQAKQVATVSSQLVTERIRAASLDFKSARASSLGDVTDVVVASVTDTHGEVFVDTAQAVSHSYAEGETNLIGLLVVTVSRSGGVWLVSDYHWLLAPGSVP
jgi:hypothetical protein